MAADFQAYKVAAAEKPASSTKMNNFIQAAQDGLNAIGDTAKMAFAAGLIFDPNQIKQNAATANQALIWDGAKWTPGSLPPSKLSQEAAVLDQVLAWNGTIWAPTAGDVLYDRNLTSVDVVNTTTETSLWSKSIGANDLGTNRGLRLRLEGDILANSGTPTVTLRIKLGATTLFADTSATLSAIATRGPVYMDLTLMNFGATNSQRLSGAVAIGLRTAPTTGIGRFFNTAASAENAQPIGGTAAEDTTVAKTFDVTVQWSVASLNLSFRKQSAVVTIL